MQAGKGPVLEPDSILALTDEGQRALQVPGTTLTPDALEVLVLVDGQTSLQRLERRARPETRATFLQRAQDLLEKGYVRISADPFGGMIDPGDFFSSPPPPGTPPGASVDRELEFLRRHGYCVNLARQGARRERPASGLNVLVVDDDPDLGALLSKYLKLEGLEVRVVATPEDIVAALRSRPAPDLVLLDVDLPRVSGFHVLARMREHPGLRAVPVIMLTATATREAVLKGLAYGADGHVTKPFKIEALVNAVKAVLGLPFNPD